MNTCERVRAHVCVPFVCAFVIAASFCSPSSSEAAVCLVLAPGPKELRARGDSERILAALVKSALCVNAHVSVCVCVSVRGMSQLPEGRCAVGGDAHSDRRAHTHPCTHVHTCLRVHIQTEAHACTPRHTHTHTLASSQTEGRLGRWRRPLSRPQSSSSGVQWGPNRWSTQIYFGW